MNFCSLQETYCFFLNAYQCMYIHYYLKTVKSQQTDGDEHASLLSNIKSLMWKKKTNKVFFYSIGGLHFTLEELKHGVLRGNRKKPGAILRTLGGYDDRSQFITEENYDPRILFV